MAIVNRDVGRDTLKMFTDIGRYKFGYGDDMLMGMKEGKRTADSKTLVFLYSVALPLIFNEKKLRGWK